MNMSDLFHTPKGSDQRAWGQYISVNNLLYRYMCIFHCVLPKHCIVSNGKGIDPVLGSIIADFIPKYLIAELPMLVEVSAGIYLYHQSRTGNTDECMFFQ